MEPNWKLILWTALISLAFHTWIYMKSDFNSSLWALSKERPWVLRKLVYAVVWPVRLAGAMLSAMAATAVWALMIGLAYFLLANLSEYV